MIAVVGLALNSSGQDPNAPPIIRSASEYNDTVAQAKTLSAQHLKDFAAGIQMGPDDVSDLKKAAALFEGLKASQPSNPGVAIGLGKIYEAIGDQEKANLNFEQTIASAGPSSADPAIIATVAEAHYELSMAEIKKGDFPTAVADATEAVRLAPLSPDYLVAEASGRVQLKQIAEAKTLIAKALKLDPANHSALALRGLIEHASKTK